MDTQAQWFADQIVAAYQDNNFSRCVEAFEDLTAQARQELNEEQWQAVQQALIEAKETQA